MLLEALSRCKLGVTSLVNPALQLGMLFFASMSALRASLAQVQKTGFASPTFPLLLGDYRVLIGHDPANDGLRHCS